MVLYHTSSGYCLGIHTVIDPCCSIGGANLWAMPRFLSPIPIDIDPGRPPPPSDLPAQMNPPSLWPSLPCFWPSLRRTNFLCSFGQLPAQSDSTSTSHASIDVAWPSSADILGSVIPIPHSFVPCHWSSLRSSPTYSPPNMLIINIMYSIEYILGHCKIWCLQCQKHISFRSIGHYRLFSFILILAYIR